MLVFVPKKCSRTIGAVIFRISHGYQVQDDHDPFIALAENAVHIFSMSTAPGAFLVDVVPFRELRFH